VHLKTAEEKKVAEKNGCRLNCDTLGENSDLPGLNFRRIGLFELFSSFCGDAIGTVLQSARRPT
jgi:hypothetical protein